MSCARPLSGQSLLDWWTGELAASERRGVEEHLLSCPSCSRHAQGMAALGDALRGLVREGGLPVVMLPGAVERLRGDVRRIREYRVAPGGGVRCTVGPDDDVVLARLVVDLGGVARLDLVTRVGDGPQRRLRDLPFDPGASELVYMAAADELRARPASVETLRLLSVEPGGERLLGEYTFDHTPWPGR